MIVSVYSFIVNCVEFQPRMHFQHIYEFQISYDIVRL